MTEDLPKFLSDEEFAAAIKQREQRPRFEHERWDNAGIRAPQQPTDGLPETTIEQKFPHIAQKLAAVWPSEACALYIKNLVVVERETRQGFPTDVIEDLLMLYEINEMRLRGIGLGQRTTAKSLPSSGAPHRKN